MSDSLEDFMATTQAMIDLASEQLDMIGKLFTTKIVWQVVRNTPGPNNQLPDTEYIATGRLRGGWVLAEAEIAFGNAWEGPRDEDGYGEAVHEVLDGEIMGAELKAAYYLNNPIAYNYLVNYGTPKMAARAFVFQAAQENTQIIAAREATAEAMAA